MAHPRKRKAAAGHGDGRPMGLIVGGVSSACTGLRRAVPAGGHALDDPHQPRALHALDRGGQARGGDRLTTHRAALARIGEETQQVLEIRTRSSA